MSGYGKKFATAAAIALAGMVALTGCNSKPADGGNNQARMLTIETGESVPAGSQVIPAGGGTMALAGPGSPVDGLRIEVPAGAYDGDKTFVVSYRPITGHTFPPNVTPISPLIQVDNGGGYAGDLLFVTIPVSLEPGDFAFVYQYDEQTGDVEILPGLGQTATAVGAVTRHFSPVGAAKMPLSLLDSMSYPTEFKPGVDSWQFVNKGSFISGGGNCSGMSLSAMWYYMQVRRPGGPALRGTIQSGSLPAGTRTDGLVEDDDLAIKMVSVVQNECRAATSLLDRPLQQFTWEGSLGGDAVQFYSIAAALYVRKQPVYVTVSSPERYASHAIICYGIQAHALQVCDPNFPAREDLTITFRPGTTLDGGTFDPYSTMQNAWLAQMFSYPSISYSGYTSMYNIDQIGQRWEQVISGGIGQSQFPPYALHGVEWSLSPVQIMDEQDLDRLQGTHVTHPVLEILANGNMETSVTIYSYDVVIAAGAAAPVPYPLSAVRLKVGDNHLGVQVYGKATWDESYDDNGVSKTRKVTGSRWLGFDWVHVYYEPLPPTVTITSPADGATFQEGKPITFTAAAKDSNDQLLTGSAIAWTSSLDGAIGTGESLTTSGLSVGSHTITATATDGAGKTGTATVTIAVNSPDQRLAWSADIGLWSGHPLAVADGRLYVSAAPAGSTASIGSVLAFDAATGQPSWTYGRDGFNSLYVNPLPANGSLYVGSDLTCLNAASGSEIWRSPYPPGWQGMKDSGAFQGGLLYGSRGITVDQYLWCGKPADGTEEWVARAGYGEHIGVPAVVGGRVYLRVGSGVECFDQKPKFYLGDTWRFDTSAPALDPVVSGGQVYVASSDGKVYGVNATSGTKQWETNLDTTLQWDANLQGDPALVGGKLFLLAYEKPSYEQKVVCLDAGGGFAWQTTADLKSGAGRGAAGSPAVTGAYVYVIDGNAVTCLDAASGSLLWQYAPGGLYESLSAPVVAGGFVYVAGYGKVYCIRAQEGDTGTWPMHRGNPARTGTP